MPNFLITGVKFDFNRFGLMTKIPVDVLRQGTGLCLTDDTPLLRDLAFPHLRYCRECLSGGFHSILFQFPLFACCPEHGMPLKDTCECGAFMPHKWPSAVGRAFKCEPCGRILWRARQEPFRPNPADEKFETAKAWAVTTIHRTLRFSNSGAPLRRWVQSGTDEKWAALGVPEMAGVFTPRALRLSDGGYWGSRRVIKRDGVDEVPSHAKTYFNVVNDISCRLGLPSSEFSTWIANYVANSQPRQEEMALVVWRCFWENLSEPSKLGDAKTLERADGVWSILKTYFNEAVVPSGFPARELAIVNSFVLKSLLHATFVHCYNVVGQRGGASRALHAISETPLPVFLVKPTDRSVIVEWAHQREIAETAWEILRRRERGAPGVSSAGPCLR